MLKFVSFLALVVSVYSATPVRQCENGVTLPLQTTVNDCTQLPCPLERGTDVVMTVIFKATSFTKTTRPHMNAIAAGVNVDDYPLSERNGCNGFLDTSCPVDVGQIITYEMRMPILAIYPEISLDLIFTLFDDSGDPIFCFDLAARIVSP